MAVKKPKNPKKGAPVDSKKSVSEGAFPEKTPVTPKVRKTAAPKKPKTAPAKVSGPRGSYIVIDHPAEGEVVSGPAYCMRLGASGNGSVEVSINGGDWAPCRRSVGYWWFDWEDYAPGSHELTARIVDSRGKLIKTSAVRKCTVL
jgi:hypothetical protein